MTCDSSTCIGEAAILIKSDHGFRDWDGPKGMFSPDVYWMVLMMARDTESGLIRQLFKLLEPSV